MAKATKVSDKLKKVNENFNVYMYDNGYMLEITGKNKDDNYATTKIICATREELIELVSEVLGMERDE